MMDILNTLKPLIKLAVVIGTWYLTIKFGARIVIREIKNEFFSEPPETEQELSDKEKHRLEWEQWKEEHSNND